MKNHSFRGCSKVNKPHGYMYLPYKEDKEGKKKKKEVAKKVTALLKCLRFQKLFFLLRISKLTGTRPNNLTI